MESSAQTGLFGSTARTTALLIVGMLGETHSAEIARVLGRSRGRTKDIVDGLETAGLIVGMQVGSARVLTLNSRYVAAAELKALIERLALADVELQGRLATIRRRPRRSGKRL